MIAYRTVGIRSIIAGVSLVGALYGYNRFYTYLFSLHTLHITYDSKLAPTTVQPLERSITRAFSSYTHINKVLGELHAQFPFIKWLSVAYQPMGVVAITVKAHAPYGIVNNELVYLPSGTCICKDVYTERECAQAYPVTINNALNAQSLMAAAARCFKSVDKELFEQFHVGWRDDTCAWFIDKQQPNCAIVWNAGRVPDIALLQRCKELLMQQINKQTTPIPKNNRWIADCRFKNQVVLYQQKDSKDSLIPFS